MEKEQMLQKLVTPENMTIREAFGRISEGTKGITFVTDDTGKLSGVVTDGDIRRALFNGGSLEDPISTVMNKNFVSVEKDTPVKEILNKFSHIVRTIPVVDSEGKIIDYYEYFSNVRIPVSQPFLGGNEYKYLADAFFSTWISSIGEYINRFESDFSKYCDCKYGVTTSNGTTALHLALTVLGIGPGDEVIVPDITFAATINAVLYTGATPVIVDIEKYGWGMLPEDVEKAITEKTKCIIPVHLYGQPCDIKRIVEIARKHNLYVIEDCAEAHGATFEGQKVGSFGDIGCFSFFGNKVITTGEGGMCVTNDERIDKELRHYRDHGKDLSCWGYHDVIGYNYRMTNMQAAIGVAQLETIEDTLEKRRQLEERYHKELDDVPGISLQRSDLPGRHKITWFVVATVETEAIKKEIQKEMVENNIDVRTFMVPLSIMDLYKDYTFSNKNSVEIASKSFCLPTYYSIGDTEIERVVNVIKDVCTKNKSFT